MKALFHLNFMYPFLIAGTVKYNDEIVPQNDETADKINRRCYWHPAVELVSESTTMLM